MPERPAPEAAAFVEHGEDDDGGFDSDYGYTDGKISVSSLGGGISPAQRRRTRATAAAAVHADRSDSLDDAIDGEHNSERIPHGTEDIIGDTRTHSQPSAAATVTPEGTKKLAVLEDDLDRLVKSLIEHDASSGSLDISVEQPGDLLEPMVPGQALAPEHSSRRRGSECSNKTDGTGHSSIWDDIDDDDDDDDEDVGEGASSDILLGTASSSRNKKSVDLCRELQLDLGGDAMMDAVEDLLSSPPQPSQKVSGPPSPPPPPTSESSSILLSPTRTLLGKKISALTLLECHAEKKRVKRRLQKYDADFYQRFGRRAEKDDKEPIRALYEIYNVVKERITEVEALELMGCNTAGEAAAAAATAGNTDRRRVMQLSDLVRIVEEDEDEFSTSSDSDGALEDDSNSGNNDDDDADVHNDTDDIGDLLVKELVEEDEIKNTSDDQHAILNVTPPPAGTAASSYRSLLSPHGDAEIKSPGQARIQDEINAQPPVLQKGFVKNQVQKLLYRSREDPFLIDQVGAAVTETSKMDAFQDFWEGKGTEPNNFEFFSSDLFSVQRDFATPSPTKAASPKPLSTVNPDSPIKPKKLFDTPSCQSPAFTIDTVDTAEVTAASSRSDVSSGFDLSSPAKQNDEPVPIAVLLMDVAQDKFDLLGICVEWEKHHVKHLLDAITGSISTHNITNDNKEESSPPNASADARQALPSSGSASEYTDDDDCSSPLSLCDPPSTINVKDTDASVGSSINLSTSASSSVRVPFHAATFGPAGTSWGTGRKWPVQYDGLIQLRLIDDNAFDGMLLINCFGLKRYDVTPHELFVAKPVGMSVKEASEHAGRLMTHLLHSGMLCSEDGASTLSLSALKRAGRSAPIDDNTTEPMEAKFLSFSPPFDIVTDVADESGAALQRAFEGISMDEDVNKDDITAVSDLLDLYPNCEEGDGVAEACPPDPLLKKVWKAPQESLHLGSFFAAVSPIHDEEEEVLMVEQYVKPQTSASPRKLSIMKSLSTITNKTQIVGKAKQVYGAGERSKNSTVNESYLKGSLKRITKKRYAKVDESFAPGICRLDRTVSEDDKTSTTSNEEVAGVYT